MPRDDSRQNEMAALRTALTRVARRLHASSSGSDFTETEMFVLAEIDNLGPISLKDVRARTRLNPTMASRVVSRLTRAELVRRTADERDRRAVRLEVTARGRQVHRRRAEDRNRVFRAAMSEVGPEGSALLLAALPALEELVDVLSRREADG